ncbi:MAG TPA: respiratory nitrate reductase subunit gamma [Actinomycetaceae bacterium]|nr:respiratory nitrate reductase subunit gamma [Actinomycetaceae bacterium]
MSGFELFWWAAFPYLALATFVVGMIWRWRTDQFGWTTRSSELYEHTILRLASPLFHIGILFVFLGHFIGLIIPKSWTSTIGISETAYHWFATIPGVTAGTAATIGAIGLIYRRRRNRTVFLATTRNDKFMYVLLALPIGLGMWATLENQVFGGAHGYDYRETISPWLRSILILQPDVALMADVPFSFKVHVISGFLLLMIWPFTRLVHAFSAPVGYTMRPYLVYRSRDGDVPAAGSGTGWEPVSSLRAADHEAPSHKS